MRLGSRFDKEREGMEVKMRNQGLRPGDQAWDSQMESFGNTKNDAYTGARFDSVGAGREEFNTSLSGNQRANALRDKGIEEYIAKRGFSLGEQGRLTEGQKNTDVVSMLNGG